MAKFNTDKKKQDRRNAPVNTAMADKLKGFKGRSTYPKERNYVDELPRLTSYDGDGLDHINIYLDPKTELGSILSPFTIRPFISPFFGRFNSRQGLYFYLLSTNGHEAFRTMDPKNMRTYARKFVSIQPFAANLKYFMTRALWLQIANNERAIELIKDNQLPFDAYYSYLHRDGAVVTKVLSRPTHNAIWMIQSVKEIVAAIKEGREPNFEQFIDRPEELSILENKFSSTYVPPEPSANSEPRPKKAKKNKSEQKPNFDGYDVYSKQDNEQAQAEQTATVEEAVVKAAEEIVSSIDPENVSGTTASFVGTVAPEEIKELITGETVTGDPAEGQEPEQVVQDVVVSDIPKDVLIPRYNCGA